MVAGCTGSATSFDGSRILLPDVGSEMPTPLIALWQEPSPRHIVLLLSSAQQSESDNTLPQTGPSGIMACLWRRPGNTGGTSFHGSRYAGVRLSRSP